MRERRFAEAADVMRTKKNACFLWVFEDLVEGADFDLLAAAAGSSTRFPVPEWRETCCRSRSLLTRS
ncbi:hypothetical protein SAMN05216188_13328 [Lentzea xinjiangensis]|uniref:Uncharacterized protein n=1 Tax=Lentzea xinjiangensis TaxID=402600 RepID=A0A1H9WFB6_9PSEU|nr:hypothetical protein [Lentzea xinjiangensis]SES32622.1 hypothetical protein SAMN05216188_13328 [Lentzea xinjiangensis]